MREKIKKYFERGDYPTEENFAFLIDSSKLINEDIYIPELKIIPKTDFETFNGTKSVAEKLYVQWDSANNNEFLKFNPKIWLFRPINKRCNLEKGGNTIKILRKKSWRHPIHKIPSNQSTGSSYYGTTVFHHPNETIKNTGRKTEFNFLNKPGKHFEIDFDWSDWLYIDKETQRISVGLLTSDYIVGKIIKASSSKYIYADKIYPYIKRYLSQPFKFAIVIDNPLFTGDYKKMNPKLIGKLSDTIKLCMFIADDNKESKVFYKIV